MNPKVRSRPRVSLGDVFAAELQFHIRACRLSRVVSAQYAAESNAIRLVWTGADPEDTLGVPAEGPWVERLRGALTRYAVAKRRAGLGKPRRRPVRVLEECQ